MKLIEKFSYNEFVSYFISKRGEVSKQRLSQLRNMAKKYPEFSFKDFTTQKIYSYS